MTIRTMARRAALAVPPVRRLWDFAITEAQRVQTLTERADTLMGELTVASDERDSLEVQLYVLRAEHQRTLARADANRQEISNLRAALSKAGERLERSDLTNIELAYAKLAGQLTRGFGVLEAQLRNSRVNQTTPCSSDRQAGLYLDLLEKALTGQLIKDEPTNPGALGFDQEVRDLGRDWPGQAQTMIGTTRMRNIRVLAERVLESGVPGDFLEAGVWRGGACIFMRGILAAYDVADRTVWVADSFAGLPKPDPNAYPADAEDLHHTFRDLAVPLEEVRANFEIYALLDEKVRFLKGWFADTLPAAPIGQLALLRLDGDMYASTIQTLEALYAKLAPGGYIIVDDYILPGCRKAVDDFRERENIMDIIEEIDGAGIFWRKG